MATSSRDPVPPEISPLAKIVRRVFTAYTAMEDERRASILRATKKDLYKPILDIINEWKPDSESKLEAAILALSTNDKIGHKEKAGTVAKLGAKVGSLIPSAVTSYLPESMTPSTLAEGALDLMSGPTTLQIITSILALSVNAKQGKMDPDQAISKINKLKDQEINKYLGRKSDEFTHEFESFVKGMVNLLDPRQEFKKEEPETDKLETDDDYEIIDLPKTIIEHEKRIKMLEETVLRLQEKLDAVLSTNKSDKAEHTPTLFSPRK